MEKVPNRLLYLKAINGKLDGNQLARASAMLVRLTPLQDHKVCDPSFVLINQQMQKYYYRLHICF